MASVDSAEGKVPASAAWLGGLGAVPFIGLACALPLLDGASRLTAAQALLAYGAVILSFLGGIHWGLAIRDHRGANMERLWARLILSVVPSLAGWIALLVAGKAGLLMLAVAVAATLLVDLRATRLGDAPPCTLPPYYPSKANENSDTHCRVHYLQKGFQTKHCTDTFNKELPFVVISFKNSNISLLLARCCSDIKKSKRAIFLASNSI
eukprot:gene39676-53637_t